MSSPILTGRIDAVLDGGATPVGLESTIVACLGEPRLLRPGGVPREALEAALGRKLLGAAREAGAPRGAGHARRRITHRARRCGSMSIGSRPGEPCFSSERSSRRGSRPRRRSSTSSQSGDLTEAAAHLFGHLRALDASGAESIAVAPIPEHGLGEAINDRLRRAAAGG